MSGEGATPGARSLRFLGGVALFSVVHGVSQLLGAIAGLLWIRTLPVNEFAFYSLALSVVTLAAVLSDLGTSSSLQHFFYERGDDRIAFFRHVEAVRRLRRLLAAVLLPFLAGALWFGAARAGFGASQLLLPGLLMLGSIWFQQEGSTRLSVRRLEGNWSRVYAADLASALVRFVGAGLAALWRLGSAAIALAVGLFAAVATVGVAGRAAGDRAESGRSEAVAVLRYALPILPDVLYFALQGQLLLWLAAIAGSVGEIAEVGALTRLGVLFSVPQALASGYLVPRLATRRDEAEFRAATLRYAAFLLAIALATCAAVVLFPEPFLRLLGSDYAGLERGLLLVLASSLCSVFGAFFVQVNRIRAWTGKLWLLIQVTVAAQVVYALFVPLTSSEAVLGLGLLASVVLTTGYGLMTFLGFRRTARGERSAVST